MQLAGCFLVAGRQVDWALNAILGHKYNQPVCPDLHTEGWATSGLQSELPAGHLGADFIVQEPPFTQVRMSRRHTDWLAEAAKPQSRPQKVNCGPSCHSGIDPRRPLSYLTSISSTLPALLLSLPHPFEVWPNSSTKLELTQVMHAPGTVVHPAQVVVQLHRSPPIRLF